MIIKLISPDNEDVVEHAAVLQIAIAMFCALFCLSVKQKHSWFIAFIGCMINLVLSIHSMYAVHNLGEPIYYPIGGWGRPYGIELRIDIISSIVLITINTIASVVMFYSLKATPREVGIKKIGHFYSVFMMLLAGLTGIVISNDVFNIYVFLEISSLTSYALIASRGTHFALRAAFNYLIIGTLGASFYLIGVGFIYSTTGTLNINDIAVNIPPIKDNPIVQIGTIFIVVGLSVKSALFPLHAWLSKIYAYAPSAVSAFMAATVTKINIYIMARILYSVFDTKAIFATLSIDEVLITLSVCSIIFGSTMAASHTHLKKILAHSSISQIAYIALCIAINTKEALVAGVIHSISHALIKACLFMTIGNIQYHHHSMVSIDKIHGIGKKMPFTSGIFTIAALALMGAPLTTGFAVKWFILESALRTQNIIIILAVLASSLMTLFYMGKIVFSMFLKPNSKEVMGLKERIPISMIIAPGILVTIILFLGVTITPAIKMVNISL